MTAKKKIIDKNGVQVYPITHTKAVLDDNGNSVEQRLEEQMDVINQKQLEVGAVPSDIMPTAGSTHWVTSGGVFNVTYNKIDATNLAYRWTNRASSNYATFELDENYHNGTWHLLKKAIQSSAIRMDLSNLTDGEIYSISFTASYQGDLILSEIKVAETSISVGISSPDYYSGNTVYVKNGLVQICLEKTSSWDFLYLLYGSVDTLTYPLDVTISNFNVSKVVSIKEELGTKVSFGESQNLSDAQKIQARANIGFGNGSMDNAPTENSANLVNSGALYTTLQGFATENEVEQLKDSIGEILIDETFTMTSGNKWINSSNVATIDTAEAYSASNAIEINNGITYYLHFFSGNSPSSNVFLIDNEYGILRAYGSKNDSWEDITIPPQDTVGAKYLLLSCLTNKVSYTTLKHGELNQFKNCVSLQPQSLSSSEKLQVQANIGISDTLEVLDTNIYGTPLTELRLFDKWIAADGTMIAGKHSIIPVFPNSNITINIGATTINFAFLKEYSIGNPVLCDDTTVINLTSSNRNYTGITPSDVKYLLVDRIVYTADRTSYIKTLSVDSYDVTSGFYKAFGMSDYPISVYEPILQSLNKTRIKFDSPGRGYADTTYKRFVLATLADIHGTTSEMKNFLNFTNIYSDYINDSIILGDIAGSDWQSTNHKSFPSLPGYNDVLKVIGNHDISNYEGTGEPATDAQCYAYYMANIENWGVQYTANKCYYYKDYDDANVRLIVLDCMHFDTAQEEWLENVLYGQNNSNSALALGRHVLIATHIPITKTYMTLWDCNFTTKDIEILDGASSRNPSILGYVDNFQTAGGIFIAYMFGHWHVDMIGVYTNGGVDYPNQTFVAYPSCTSAFNDGVPLLDNFTLTAVDTKSKRLALYRVGIHYDRNLVHKESIVLSYKDNDRKIISQY